MTRKIRSALQCAVVCLGVAVIASGCAIRGPATAEAQTESKGGPYPDGDCGMGKGLACQVMGGIAARDFKRLEIENDGIRAATWLYKACRFGDLEGCRQLGLFLQTRDKSPKALKRARGWIEYACDKGLSEGCATLGEQWKDGIGGPRNVAQAFEAVSKACGMGSARGCYLEGTAWYTGWAGQFDMARARRLYQAGCEAGVGESCLSIAGMLFRGEGGPEDDQLAAELAQKACTLGLEYACLDKQEEDDEDAAEAAPTDEPLPNPLAAQPEIAPSLPSE